MNLRTTILLALLVGLGACAWFFGPDIATRLGYGERPVSSDNISVLTILKDRLTRENIDRIEVQNGTEKFTLVKGQGGVWSLTGNWPTRPGETEDLVGLLTDLRTRFEIISVDFGNPDWKPYGVDPSQKPVRVLIHADKDYTLLFGEGASVEGEPFARPTYLVIDGRNCVVRLGPDILPILRRPQEYYQRRQLFPSVDRFKFADSRPPLPGQPEQGASLVPIPQSKRIEIEGPQGKVVLTPVPGAEKTKSESFAPSLDASQLAARWNIVEPVTDKPEPERLKSLLSAIPDLWVESFKPPNETALVAASLIASPTDALENVLAWVKVSADAGSQNWLQQKTGLDQPKYKVAVTLPTGDTVRLDVGNVSQVKERPGTPPPPQPGAPPLPPVPVREEYRYARLEGQPLIFEIKADKFNDLFVPASTLRDEKLARFQSRDVDRVEIQQPESKMHILGLDLNRPGVKIVLVRDKDEKKGDKWRIIEPIQALAETDKIADLLDRLSGLEARDKDVIDNANLKETGFEPAAGDQITLSLTEELPGPTEPKQKRSRTVAFSFGKHDVAAKKLDVRVAGRERVNIVDDAVLALADRPALAYRGRRVLDFESGQIARIDIKQPKESFALQQDEGNWRLTAPVMAVADKVKASSLANDLGRLEAVEYVNDAPKPADLASAGLDHPDLSATINFSDPATKAQTISIGKQRGNKPEYFARIGTGSIFVVKKEERDKLEQGSLTYRVTQLWTMNPDDLNDLKVERGADAFEIKRDGINWKIVKPFEAIASSGEVRPMVDAIATMKLLGYQAHSAPQPAEFGLDKPQVKLTFSVKEKGQGGAPDRPRERTLLIGKAVPGKPESYAKLADDPAVFTVAESVELNTNKSALDLLDRKLLSVDNSSIAKIERTGAAKTTAVRDGKIWKIQADGESFTADEPTMAETLRTWGQLQAERFAAYGPNVKLEDYGLKSPSDVLKITLDATAGNNPETHELKLGKADKSGGRFAQVDSGPGVAVLPSFVVAELARNHLDYADRSLIAVDESSIQSIRRQMKGNDLEIDRKDGWTISKPAEQKADEQLMEAVTHQLAALRAERVAAYGSFDLKNFGLDSPIATITIVTEKEGKPTSHVLKIGAPSDAKEPDGSRYVTVEGSKSVDVLARMFVRRLLGEPISFRDRTLVKRLPDVDKVVLERGDRAGDKKAIFTKVEGTWKMTAPVAAEAEHSDLEEFVNSLYKLRADELVADALAPAKLKEYGLEKPEATWHFFSGDREVLSMQVGKRDSTDQRVYAKLSNGSVIFLLNPAVTSRATAEYRKRSLWTGFDAAQVDSLTLGGSGGPSTLHKVNGAWQIDGKPDLKLKQDAVNDMLVAFANLKAERFVSDKDASMSLYGLDKPRRTIVARTSAGMTQVLLLGNREGGGKRVYAAIPGKTEVFVLSELDTAKLDGDLKALEENSPKDK
jgi:hypothetical protein